MCSVLSKSLKLCGESSSPHLLQVWALTCTVGLQVQGDVTYFRMGARCGLPGQARLQACIPVQKLPVSALLLQYCREQALTGQQQHPPQQAGPAVGSHLCNDAAVNEACSNSCPQIRTRLLHCCRLQPLAQRA